MLGKGALGHRDSDGGTIILRSKSWSRTGVLLFASSVYRGHGCTADLPGIPDSKLQQRVSLSEHPVPSVLLLRAGASPKAQGWRHGLRDAE